MVTALALARPVAHTVSVAWVLGVAKVNPVSAIRMPVAMTAVIVQRATDVSVSAIQIRSFAVQQVVEQHLLPRQFLWSLLPRPRSLLPHLRVSKLLLRQHRFRYTIIHMNSKCNIITHRRMEISHIYTRFLQRILGSLLW